MLVYCKQVTNFELYITASLSRAAPLLAIVIVLIITASVLNVKTSEPPQVSEYILPLEGQL